VHILLVARILGLFALLFSATLVAPMLVAWVYQEPDLSPFVYPMAGSLAIGAAFSLAGLRGHAELGVRDGFLIVALFWLLVSALGAWPFVLGAGLTPMGALFESASGFTTTGATVITDLDQLPHSLLFYRQQIQWLGGMGVVVLGLAVIPLLGIGGTQLYRAEAPGPLKDEKLTPRLLHTARSLWLLYLLLTLACALGYWLAGMNGFDALAHSLSTVSTGGFSTRDESIGYYQSPAIEAVGVVFMLGHRVVEPVLIQAVWGYFAVYIITFGLLSLLMIHTGLDPVSAFTAVATSINNLGPGLGEVAYNFATVTDGGKLLAVIAMIMGRLEIFTILVLLSPSFWRG